MSAESSLIVHDAWEDERFADNPLVPSSPHTELGTYVHDGQLSWVAAVLAQILVERSKRYVFGFGRELQDRPLARETAYRLGGYLRPARIHSSIHGFHSPHPSAFRLEGEAWVKNRWAF